MRALISAVASVLVVGLFALPATSYAAADSPGIGRITFESDCTGVPGHVVMREVRGTHDSMHVHLLATGLPIVDRTWDGEVYIQPDQYALVDTFRVRAPEGDARHSTHFDVPVASTMVSASLMDIESEDQPSCDLSGSRTDTSALVSSGSSQLMVDVFQGRLAVSVTDYQCASRSTWHGRLVAIWTDHVVRRSLGSDRCRHTSYSLGSTLPGTHLPRSLSVVARDDDGHAWRASYAIGH